MLAFVGSNHGAVTFHLDFDGAKLGKIEEFVGLALFIRRCRKEEAAFPIQFTQNRAMLVDGRASFSVNHPPF